MPITQSRLRDLLEEYERWLRTIDEVCQRADEAYHSSTKSTSDKMEILYGETLLLRDIPRTYAIVERRDLNRNWKRNQRLAAKQERKRRAAGIAPRGEPTASDWLPHEADFDEAAYIAHNNDPANQANSEIALCMAELQLARPPSESLLETWRQQRANVPKPPSGNMFGGE